MVWLLVVILVVVVVVVVVVFAMLITMLATMVMQMFAEVVLVVVRLLMMKITIVIIATIKTTSLLMALLKEELPKQGFAFERTASASRPCRCLSGRVFNQKQLGPSFFHPLKLFFHPRGLNPPRKSVCLTEEAFVSTH